MVDRKQAAREAERARQNLRDLEKSGKATPEDRRRVQKAEKIYTKATEEAKKKK